MSIPVLHSLRSPDLERPSLPPDPLSCAISINAEIGPAASGGADGFSFIVVTPDQLLGSADRRWGRGCLVVREFSWESVESAVRKLLKHADRPRWEDAARELAKEMHWEFEGYSEHVAR
jgi:hypothetical protein